MLTIKKLERHKFWCKFFCFLEPNFGLVTMNTYRNLYVDMTLIQHVNFCFMLYQSHIDAKIVSIKSVSLDNLLLYLKNDLVCAKHDKTGNWCSI